LSRPARLTLIGVGVIVFLAISFLLARILSASGAERSAVTHLIEAEARGNAAEMIGRIHGCRAEPSCRAAAQANAAKLKRPGQVQVLNYAASVSFGIANTSGTGRIAWRVPGRPAVVQCAHVERRGNPVSGFEIHVLALTAPIRSDASCP
jgi:hypothetical protein